METRTVVLAAEALLADGGGRAALSLVRAAWHPDLPATDQVALLAVWIRALRHAGEGLRAQRLSAWAVALHPETADLWHARAEVLLDAGDPRGALSALDRAVERGAGPSASMLRARVLHRVGRSDEALEVLAGLVEGGERADDPRLRRDAVIALVDLLYATGRSDEARGRLAAHLTRDPADVRALLLAAHMARNVGDLEAACRAFERVLAVRPRDPEVHFHYALALRGAGKLPDAVAHAARARALDPSNPMVALALASLRLERDGRLTASAARLVHEAVEQVLGRVRRSGAAGEDGREVIDGAFRIFRRAGRRDEARWVARVAAQQDIWTPVMAQTLGTRAAAGGSPLVPFWVVARARSRRPLGHWPKRARGFTTDLAVYAPDAEQARREAAAFLREVEGEPSIELDLEVLSAEAAAESGRYLRVDPDDPPMAGVSRLLSRRNYFWR